MYLCYCYYVLVSGAMILLLSSDCSYFPIWCYDIIYLALMQWYCSYRCSIQDYPWNCVFLGLTYSSTFWKWLVSYISLVNKKILFVCYLRKMTWYIPIEACWFQICKQNFCITSGFLVLMTCQYRPFIKFYINLLNKITNKSVHTTRIWLKITQKYTKVCLSINKGLFIHKHLISCYT